MDKITNSFQATTIGDYLQRAETSTTHGEDPVTSVSSSDVMLVSALLGQPSNPLHLDTSREKQSSSLSPRDRDIYSEPLLASGSVLNIAGQASSEGQQEFVTHLQCIIDKENAELMAMETHLNNASDIIMMLHESSQTGQSEHLMRIIDDDIEDQKLKKQKMEQDEHDNDNVEREQLHDDVM
jgi:hypothetical protein